jgi:t-SNARE complex subunit (syntaxin)
MRDFAKHVFISRRRHIHTYIPPFTKPGFAHQPLQQTTTNADTQNQPATMSFDRLSSLESQPTSASAGYSDDPEFSRLATSLSTQLFTITSNITQLNRQLALVGTRKDSEAVRERVRRLSDDTRAAFKAVSDGVKKVRARGDDGDITPAMKYTQDKLQAQLASTLADFQAAQRLCAEKTRLYVSAARRVQREQHQRGVEGYTDDDGDGGEGEQVQVPLVQQQQQQQQQQAALADQGEVEFQEGLIVEREEEIRGIERGITELNDIFRDLGMMVTEQGEQLDVIDANVSSVVRDQKDAEMELRSAARYQRGARNRACCLLLILAVVMTVVLLAVGFLFFKFLNF